SETSEVFLWTPEKGLVDLGVKGSNCHINDQGQIVGFWREPSEANPMNITVAWSPERGIVDLEELFGKKNLLRDINNRGECLVVSQTTGKGRIQSLENSDDPIVIDVSPDLILRPLGLNDVGRVFGTVVVDGGERGSFLWGEGGFQVADSGTQTSFLLFKGMNNHGQVIGREVFSSGTYRGFFWEGGKVRSLKDLDGPFCSAEGINDRGQIVGYATNPKSKILNFLDKQSPKNQLLQKVLNSLKGFFRNRSDREAILWEDRDIIVLNDAIPPDSGWTLFEAVAVNNKGQIAGTGHVNGKYHAYLLTPIDEETGGG
ncbi:MAG: hypothetical protein KC964_27790, partial [Candidatus Omnitrophica bacterium]|nr:hypothetical protein [Candidatus Omnitrophota bacterium]